MARPCFKFVLAWLLAMVGAGHSVTGLVAPPRTWADMVHLAKNNDADPEAPHEPLSAEGQALLIQARTEMRCRYAFTDLKRTYKIYRIFLGHSMVAYPGWCEAIEAAVRGLCGKDKLGPDEIEWLRCDTDGHDLLWQRGAVATFKLNVPTEVRPRCVTEAVRASVPGSQVGWMGQRGCYEAYGFEIEY
ncbi:hypothetical protein HRG_004157 [Hirsutella rhossiliensis]|uniref:Uncharacterized protein n=1 Tax=Hirsutella rhossiliensis TaxID=111463 RepID=A0A9P8SMH6_9HYPO|nr:uncharacterized protein HRG_04157 [Hirsutella rhossiliensis]KAH0966141.1 hypothetical protein HRG_04157 [Hirsutella rhossiliensis]